MWGHLSLTLLQQSHLCPLPLLQQPIYWQHDHAMHLYPLPHAVVLADTSPQAQHEHQACTMLNPVRGVRHRRAPLVQFGGRCATCAGVRHRRAPLVQFGGRRATCAGVRHRRAPLVRPYERPGHAGTPRLAHTRTPASGSWHLLLCSCAWARSQRLLLCSLASACFPCASSRQL